MGGAGWARQMRALQNATIQSPMQFSYYIYYLCHENVWRRDSASPWRDAFVDGGAWKPLDWGRGDQSIALLRPEKSYGFYSEIFKKARDDWGMSMLFKDDLADQGQRIIEQYPSTFGVKSAWLGGLTGALQDLGLSMQACMTAPAEIMGSAQNMSAISNARVSGDGGRNVAQAAFGALLTSLVGIAWSKDNVRTTVCAPQKDCTRGSTAKTTGFEHLQMLLACLSLGPVGVSDPLTALPNETSARITSNVSLIRRCTAVNGSLLQPSFPITALPDGSRAATSRVWATHTSIPCGCKASGCGLCHYLTAVGFSNANAGIPSEQQQRSPAALPPQCQYHANADKTSGHNFKIAYNRTRAQCCAACHALKATCEAYVRDNSGVSTDCYLITGMSSNATHKVGNREVGFMAGPLPRPKVHTNFSLSLESDLLPMVDAESATPNAFELPPSGFFLGDGTAYPPRGAAAYVVSEAARDGASAAGTRCARLHGAGRSELVDTSGDWPQQLNFAPVLPGAKLVLLGEAAKFAAVSTFRFASVSVTAGGGLRLALRGSVGENVSLSFASIGAAGAAGLCEERVFVLKANGETIVELGV